MQRHLFDVQETSKQAFKELGEKKRTRCQEYIDTLWKMQKPSTDYEVSRYAGHSDPNYFRPRRYELQNGQGMIMECIKRPCSVTGKLAKTFWFTSDGLRLIGDGRE